MRVLIIVCLLLLGSVYADDYNYEGDSGKQYKYDMSDPYDAIDYGTDVWAQQEDQTYGQNDSDVEYDQSQGQYGAGAEY